MQSRMQLKCSGGCSVDWRVRRGGAKIASGSRPGPGFGCDSCKNFLNPGTHHLTIKHQHAPPTSLCGLPLEGCRSRLVISEINDLKISQKEISEIFSSIFGAILRLLW